KGTPLQSFAEAKVVGLYHGVDMRLYRDQGRPRFDLLVAPHVNTDSIRFHYLGAESAAKAGETSLVVGTRAGNFSVGGLKAYTAESKEVVPCSFRDNGDGTFGFAVGPHDPNKPLVIDPYVIF